MLHSFKFKTSAAVKSGPCLKYKGTRLRVGKKTVSNITGPKETLVLVLNLRSHDVLFVTLILSFGQSILVATPLPRTMSSTLLAPNLGDLLMITSSHLCFWDPVMPE